MPGSAVAPDVCNSPIGSPELCQWSGEVYGMRKIKEVSLRKAPNINIFIAENKVMPINDFAIWN